MKIFVCFKGEYEHVRIQSVGNRGLHQYAHPNMVGGLNFLNDMEL